MIKTVIGLEIHLEILTKRKAFSNASTSFEQEPNSCVSEIDLGYPGTLPMIEKELIIQGLKACHILNMNIAGVAVFDRKHYQYPDLPKGFQITQFFNPIGTKGKIILESGKIVTITEIHLEEDTAKRTYLKDKVHIDYNRCGKPLLEIVTDPVFRSKEEVIEFLRWLRSEMINSKISEGAMEKGSLRCDVNISLLDDENMNTTNRIEVKNINSFRAISDAIDYEVETQKKHLDNKSDYPPQTKRFDMDTKTTRTMRLKDSVLDYRYMQEPNILPFEIKEEWIKEAKESLSISLVDLKEKFSNIWKVNKEVWEPIISNKLLFDIFKYFLNSIDEGDTKQVNKVSSWIAVYFADIIRHTIDISVDSQTIGSSIPLIYEALNSNLITSDNLENVFKDLFNNVSVKKSIKKHKIEELVSNKDLNSIIDKVINNNQDFISENIENRRERVEKMLMGQVMKETRGKAQPKDVMSMLKNKLSS